MSRRMAEIQRLTESHDDVRLISLAVEPRTDTPKLLEKIAVELSPVSCGVNNGDLPPDFPIPAESGVTNAIADFRDRAAAITFNFTRLRSLPVHVPPFRNRGKILLARTGRPTNGQFVSVSFDPENDTPTVPNECAEAHRGSGRDRWVWGVVRQGAGRAGIEARSQAPMRGRQFVAKPSHGFLGSEGFGF
jgi:cytochrome oxidase Cu insertion factor (SCO1/SenC/PrrC family)